MMNWMDKVCAVKLHNGYFLAMTEREHFGTIIACGRSLPVALEELATNVRLIEQEWSLQGEDRFAASTARLVEQMQPLQDAIDAITHRILAHDGQGEDDTH